MSENGVLKITESNLQEVINFCARKCVGKMMKRFEIHDNLPVLKAEMKELCYESYRDLEDLLLASSKGLQITVFKLDNTKREPHST